MAKGEEQFEVGTMVKFLGYTDTDEMEDADFLLEDGQVAKIVDIDEEEESYTLEIPNPNFDTSKRKSAKANPEFIKADAFFEEVEASEEDEAEEEEAEEEEAPAKKKATTKKKAAPKKKATAKGKGRAKAAPKKAAAARKAAEEDEEQEEAALTDPDGRDALENEDEEILGMVEGVSSDELLELAHEVVEEATTADYKVGGILYHVRLTGAYHDLNPDYAEKGGFEAYINEELGMEYRKAMYLIDIYYKFNQYGIGSDVVASVGWTKASQIARVMTEENADALIDAAENSTVADLKETIKEDFVVEGGTTRTPTAKKVTFKFRLFEDQASSVEQYLSQAEETLGLNDLNQVFEHIVTEWAGEHLDVRAQQKTKRTTTKKKVAAKKKAPVKKKATAKKKAPVRKAAGGKAAPKRKVATKRKAAPRKKAARR